MDNTTENVNIDTTTTNNEVNETTTSEEIIEKTYTQAEVDEMMKGLHNQEQVNEIVEKRLARERAKIEKEIGKSKFEEGLSEAEKLAKMTAQEKAEYEFNKQREAFEKERDDFNKAKLQTEGKSILTDLGYSGEDIEALSGLIDFTDADTTKTSIDNLDKVIKTIVNARVQAEVDKRIVNTNNPTVSANKQSEQQTRINAIKKSMGL